MLLRACWHILCFHNSRFASHPSTKARVGDRRCVLYPVTRLEELGESLGREVERGADRTTRHKILDDEADKPGWEGAGQSGSSCAGAPRLKRFWPGGTFG